MPVNYASKYSGAVDERFKLGAITTPIVGDDYDFTGVNAVNVYSVPTVALTDYSTSGSSRYGTPTELQNNIQTLTLTRDRSFTFTIDRRSNIDTQMTLEAGKALAREIDEVVIPEIDMYRLAKIIASAGTLAQTTVTKLNAYETFLDGVNALTNAKAPTAGRVAYIGTKFYKSIRLDESFIKSSDLGQDMLLKGQVGMLDGIPLILAPDSYYPSAYEAFNFLITHKIATVSPIKLADYKIHDNPPGINGWLVEGRFYYDAFVLNNKKGAIYANVQPYQPS